MPGPSFWDTCDSGRAHDGAAPAHSEQLPHNAKVVIVGGGLSGVSVAYNLHLRGLPSVIIDARSVGGGASGRNGGHLHPIGSRIFERQTTKALLACVKREGIDANIAQVRGAPLTQASDDWHPWDDDKAWRLHPLVLVERLLAACGDNVTVVQHTAVTEITPDTFGPTGAATLFAVTTSAGPIRCEEAIVCTNGWLQELCPDVKVQPARNMVIATSPLAVDIGTSQKSSFFTGPNQVYVQQRVCGRVILGGMRSLLPDNDLGNSNDHIVETNVTDALEQFLHNQYGAEAGPYTVTHKWAGTLGFAVDGAPAVGRRRDGVYVLGGWGGHGMPCIFGGAWFITQEVVRKLQRHSQATFLDVFFSDNEELSEIVKSWSPSRWE